MTLIEIGLIGRDAPVRAHGDELPRFCHHARQAQPPLAASALGASAVAFQSESMAALPS
jgi:hypothetical protein